MYICCNRAKSKLHRIISPLFAEQSFVILSPDTVLPGRLAPDQCKGTTRPQGSILQLKATHLQGNSRQWEKKMSQPAQTQMSWELAELTKQHCFTSRYQHNYLKGRDIWPRTKHTFVFPKLYGSLRLDRESKL